MRGPSVVERDVDTVLHLLRIEPLTRKELVQAMQDERRISDSTVRVAIEEARARGELVIHDGERYRLAGSYEEYANWRDRDPIARARRLEEQVRAMNERAVLEFGRQMELM